MTREATSENTREPVTTSPRAKIAGGYMWLNNDQPRGIVVADVTGRMGLWQVRARHSARFGGIPGVGGK